MLRSFQAQEDTQMMKCTFPLRRGGVGGGGVGFWASGIGCSRFRVSGKERWAFARYYV